MFYFYHTSALYKVYALCMLFSWHSIILLTLSTAKGQQTPHGGSGGMAMSLQLKPPDNFDFSKPDTWQKWKKRFEQFRVASGLKEESDPRQVSTLLYCMGEEAESVLSSTDIKDDDEVKYDPVIANSTHSSKSEKKTSLSSEQSLTEGSSSSVSLWSNLL